MKRLKIVVKRLIGIRNPPFLIKSKDGIKAGQNSFENGGFKVKGGGEVTIGNYCAFGENITLITSNHNYNFPSIQYTFYKKNFNKRHPGKVKRGVIQIGSDVWIGDNVIILPDVVIGNGVCIGAGSVVTKSLPDYSIAAGVPARVLKYRFNPDKIAELQKIKWWNWDATTIKKNENFFFTNLNETNPENR